MNFKFKFDIIKNRKKLFILSSVITVLGIMTMLIFNLNYGVDFKAGTMLDIEVGKSIEKAHAADLIKTASGYTPDLTIGGNNKSRVSARFDKQISPNEVAAIKSAFIKEYGDKVSNDESTVDPQLAFELGKKAIYAVLLASLGIIIYVSIRFEWRFALAGIIALLHDAFIVVSFFSIFRLEVNLPFVAAVLTIIGYSINDTIVIFDRIRENLRFAKIKSFNDLAALVNKSIWQTMTRSINTVLTVLFAALCLFIFGSESIRMFSLAMIIGLVSGAYSSIFIASPIWLLMKNKSMNNHNKKLAAAKE